MMEQDIEMMMVRRLTEATADCTEFNIQRMVFNTTVYAPQSVEVKEARARLMGILNGVEMDGYTRLTFLTALNDYAGECVREGRWQGIRDTEEAFAQTLED